MPHAGPSGLGYWLRTVDNRITNTKQLWFLPRRTYLLHVRTRVLQFILVCEVFQTNMPGKISVNDVSDILVKADKICRTALVIFIFREV